MVSTMKEDPGMILKSSELHKNSFTLYRYVINHDPVADPLHPFYAYRENVRVENDEVISVCRYWCSPCRTLVEAEKAYQSKIESEGAKKV